MERFGNASHDDIEKLIDKSKNKNMTKAIAKVIPFLETVIMETGSELQLVANFFVNSSNAISGGD